MKIPRLTAHALLLAVVAHSAGAQYLAPAALKSFGSTTREPERSGADASASGVAHRIGALTRSGNATDDVNRFGLVAGGIAGGAAGLFLGGALGVCTASGCHGEECTLGPALLGAVIGESVLMAVGAHFVSGSGRSDRLAIGAASALGITAAAIGVSLLAHDGNVAGVVLPLAPVLQLATMYFIETH